MKNTFNIKVLEFKIIEELPNAWNFDSYKNLLNVMEYGDISDIADNDLKDMCLMYLSENDPEESAAIVLDYIFNERLNSGQKDNLSNEMIDEKMYEEYADIAMHEEFFNIHQLLYKAYNGKFPHPEAVSFKIEISSKNKQSLSIFDEQTEATLLRLLVQGMPDNTLIKRLYDEQLEKGKFNEAKDIIWQLTKQSNELDTFIFSITSSAYWFKDLKYADDFDVEISHDVYVDDN